MKKNLLFLLSIILIAGFNGYRFTNNFVLTDPMLSNIEALAGNEWPFEIIGNCKLVEHSPTCSVCEFTGNPSDFCNISSQLPDCY